MEPPATRVRLKALADALHSASEGDNKGFQDEFTATGWIRYDKLIEEGRHISSFDERLVYQAKIQQHDTFSEMVVYKVVPRTDHENDEDVVCISTRCVLMNKGSNSSPVIKARRWLDRCLLPVPCKENSLLELQACHP